MFREGDLCQAYNRNPRVGGKLIAIIQIASFPFQQRTSYMTEVDFEFEGFAYMEEHGLKVANELPRYFFDLWKMANELVTVVDFRIIQIEPFYEPGMKGVDHA